MRVLLEKRNSRAPGPLDGSKRPTTQDAGAEQWGDIQFVPARWLVLALSIPQALFAGRRISKVGIASLAWSLTPRSLKIAATGFALAATVVFFGAIAAIALLALQLT